MNETAVLCPACGAENSAFNPRCARCDAALSECTAEVSSSGVMLDESAPPIALVAPLAITVLAPDPNEPPAPSPRAQAPLDLQPGATLGRFEVQDTLGKGAMGVVVRARDPVLRREVAIKVLRPEALGRKAASQARARLVREAQAMAMIKHPNVVTVHEVDVAAEDVLVVMEYVEGRTLRAFCAEERRPAGDVLRAFVQAGSGLAEVHRAGLVHRDFKPDNVLVGADGRVRVTDFGLVGLAEGEAEGVDVEARPGTPGEASRAMALTRSGSLLGTPAYMAPEQHERREADARADQFAFCVSLWEALARELPFAGETYAELRENVILGKLREPPRGMPMRIQRVLARGLMVDRDARYPAMEALLADMTKDPAAVRRRALAVAGALALAGFTALGASQRSPAALCHSGEVKLSGVWDNVTKAKVREAFASTGKPYAEDTYRRMERALDDRARAWLAMYTDSCEATHMRGEQSAALLDLRTACLERRRLEIGALTALFARGPDGEVLDRSVQAVLALPSLEGCADMGALTAAIPPPTDASARARVETLRASVAEVKALEDGGKYKEALALAGPLVSEAHAAGYAPVEAEALLMLGRAERDMNDTKTAEATLREAALTAARAKDDAIAADAWTDLIHVIGYLEGRFTDALALRLAAEGAVERIGSDSPAGARLLGTLGRVLNEQGKYGEAAQHVERAIAILEKKLGPQHPNVGAMLSSRGTILVNLERFDESDTAYRRALAVYEASLGPDHPHVALALNNLARVFNDQHRPQDAVPYLERAITIQERSLGLDHPYLAVSLNNLGNALFTLGQIDRARAIHERALSIREKALGPEHPDVAMSLNNLGSVLEGEDRPAEAMPYFQRALTIREKALGPDHRSVASSLLGMGHVLMTQKRYGEARVHFERAVAVLEGAIGPSSLSVASALTDLAGADLAMGKPAQALPLLERALIVYAAKEKEVDPADLAKTQYEAARTLWGQGRERERRRAIDLATKARDGWAAVGAGTKKALADVNAWLAARGAR